MVPPNGTIDHVFARLLAVRGEFLGSGGAIIAARASSDSAASATQAKTAASYRW
jgi:hypothetical protein